ncbi:MAG: seg [archaeon GW2011_AR5]|nr:MAG: seg [archaeon GW2011_AR5]
MHTLIKKRKKVINKMFELTEKPDNWEVYLSLEGKNEFALLKPVCSECQKYWSVNRKECFLCKTKYYRIKICKECSSIYPENVTWCINCDKKDGKKKGTKTVKICINCGAEETGRSKIFVPITFCWYCGNRENEFTWKIKSF